MSTAYLNAIETADKAVGRVLTGLQEAGLRDAHHIILQSDHGGHGHHHTIPDDAVMTIPRIAAGPTIRAGHTIHDPASSIRNPASSLQYPVHR
jgi:arylsulfatase A-like enzyme